MADKLDNKPDSNEDEPLGAAGMRALEAERAENKSLKKKLETLERKLNDAEAAQLSKEEKLQKDLIEAQNRVKALEDEKEQSQIRRAIAAETGVPEDLIVGSDKDSMKASAKRLQEYIGEKVSPQRPEPNPHLGNEQGEKVDSDAAALQVLGFSNLT